MRKLIVALFSTAIAFLLCSAPVTHAAPADSIQRYAEKFIGTPYVYAGNTPEGFDCSGFIRYVFEPFGKVLPRTANDQFSVGQAVPEGALMPGDLVFFEKTYNAPGITHSGIYIGNNQFISAETTRGVAISTLIGHPYWGSKYVGAKRVFGEVIQTETPGIGLESHFTDIDSAHPAFQAIIELSGKNIVTGFPNATFQPDELVSRGQAAAMLNRHMKLTATQPVKFSDVGNNHKFAKDIAAMNEAGILQGFEDGSFGVNESLTKAQLAMIMDRAFKLSDSFDVQTATTTYKDVPASYRAYLSIMVLKMLDKTTMFQTDQFLIQQDATRAEFSAALYSAITAMK